MRIAKYKIKSSKEKLTSQSGLILFGEFIEKVGFNASVRKHMRLEKSNRAYGGELYIKTIILMLHAGGRYLEDVRLIERDVALRRP